MNRSEVEERIAQLQAQAHVQRLGAQLAILDAREQLAPLKSAVGVIGMAVHALSPSNAAGGSIGRLARFGIGHPWISSTVGAFAWRVLRHRPLALLIAAAAGAAAWWLWGPSARPGTQREPPE